MEPRRLLAASPLIIASLGDSLTDEYQFYGAATPPPPSFPALLAAQATTLPPEIYLTGRDGARNWVEQVGATLSSQLSFGDFTTTQQGQTRNQGYQENWAENGATASGPDVSGSGTTFAEEYDGIPPEFSLGEDPMPGLNTQTSDSGITIGDVNVVAILIGANDYNAALSAYTEQSDKLDTSVFDTANTNIENGIATAITSIQAAAAAQGNTSLKFVIITTPDITVSPLIQDEAGSAITALKPIIGAHIDALDLNLATAYAGNSSVGLVDSKAIIDNFIANPVIDGVTVNMEAGGQDYTDGFIGDGFHPGTIVQGLITQAVVNKINDLEGAQVVTPVTDADIVNYAEISQPSIAFSSSVSETTVGQDITFRATVTPAQGATAIPTGTVTFEEIIPAIGSAPARPGIILGTVPLGLDGTATLNVKNLIPGDHPIAAIYNGDQNTDARLSTILDQKVNTEPALTSTVLYATGNSIPGQPTTLTAIVAPQEPGLPPPTGVVTFIDQTTNTVLGTAMIAGQGTATLNAMLVGAGPHQIVASYGGSILLAPSVSQPVVMGIPPATVTTFTTHQFIANGRRWLDVRILVTTIDASAGQPTGAVKLSLGAFHVVKLRLSSGAARFAVPLGPMAGRSISAVYPGNGNLLSSGSQFLAIDPRLIPSESRSQAPGPRALKRDLRLAFGG